MAFDSAGELTFIDKIVHISMSDKALARQGLKRMFLHAHRIRFMHPVDGREVVVEAPLAPELAAFVARLDAVDG